MPWPSNWRWLVLVPGTSRNPWVSSHRSIARRVTSAGTRRPPPRRVAAGFTDSCRAPRDRRRRRNLRPLGRLELRPVVHDLAAQGLELGEDHRLCDAESGQLIHDARRAAPTPWSGGATLAPCLLAHSPASRGRPIDIPLDLAARGL